MAKQGMATQTTICLDGNRRVLKLEPNGPMSFLGHKISHIPASQQNPWPPIVVNPETLILAFLALFHNRWTAR